MPENKVTFAADRRRRRRMDTAGRQKRQAGKLRETDERLRLMRLISEITRQNDLLEQSIKRLETEVEKVFYDPLTGIYNRRFFDENLERLIKTLARAGGELTLMMIDIDYFKQYNDLYGHMNGDTCLQIIAKTLHDSVKRLEDFAARYGGDEIAVVLPNCNEKGAHMIALRLLESIRERRIPHEKNQVADYATISIGVATGPVKPVHRKDDFIGLADKMLYQSKQRSRNTYSLAALE